MPVTTNILTILISGLRLALVYWWTWLPVILAVMAYREWMDYMQEGYLAGMKWTILEIIAPPDVPFASPRAADNFFAGVHASYTGGTNWKSQFFQGKVPDWFSFEIVSDGGDTHFYIRCTEGQRNVIESLLFAQYPDAEIRVVPDYLEVLPAKLDLSQYDVSGQELEFTKDQAYPLKTYPDFEKAGGKDEYERLDPIAPLLEIMSALRPGEHLWVQYIIRATGGDWAKENQKVVDKLVGKPEKPAPEPLIGQILLAPFRLIGFLLTEFEIVPRAEPKKEEKAEFNLSKLTPTQKDQLERVEHKLAKLAFKTGLRVFYLADKASFNDTRLASVSGMYKQLYDSSNSFKPGNATRDKGMFPWMFPGDKGFLAGERTNKKKHDMYEAYRYRAFPGKLVILTTEELATLWHMPAINVKAPLVARVQAKKGQPPAILPTR